MSDVPLICAQCLGDKDHLKMVKQAAGEQCKLCTRPFTVFRWNTSQESRQSKKTIFCNTCSRARNCCSSCMVDVDYGIPIDIRDAALKMAGIENQYAVDSNTRNSEVKAIIADKLEEKNKKLTHGDNAEKKENAEAILKALSAKLASGGSVRPKQKALEMSNKEISKTISKLPFGGNLRTPEDAGLKSFFVFGFSPDMPQYVLSNYFEQYGPLTQTKIVHQAKCGFVVFQTRSAAEKCASAISSSDINKGKNTAGLVLPDGKETVRVCWGQPRVFGVSKDEQSKIGIVVTKVMSQLAAKDRGKGKSQKGPGSEKKTYKALSKDVEF